MERMILLATEKSVEALKKGLRILIVGGRTTNFPDELRQDGRLVFWDSTDPDSGRPKPVPGDVGVALLTRFTGHSNSTRIRLSVDCIGPLSNGQISNLVTDAIATLNEESQASASETAKDVQRTDFSDLPDFLIDQLGNDELGEKLLTNEEVLTRLQASATARWPDITRQRIVRALRHALYLLGLFEITATESSAETPEADSEPAESPEERIKALTGRIGELQAEVSRLTRERRGIEERRRKDERKAEREIERLKSELKRDEGDLKTVLNLFINATEWIREQCGLQVTISSNATEVLTRLINKFAQ